MKGDARAFMYPLKVSYLTLCIPLALALGFQSDSCRRRGESAPVANSSPQTENRSQGTSKSTPRAKGGEGQKVKSVDVGEILTAGEWGGQHVSLTVKETGASIEYDCAHGTIDERVKLDADGRFDVRGTHEHESGGPSTDVSAVNDDDKASPPGAGANRHPARYTGRVEGRAMSLTVTLTDDGSTFGKFVLTRGASGSLYKCRT